MQEVVSWRVIAALFLMTGTKRLTVKMYGRFRQYVTYFCLEEDGKRRGLSSYSYLQISILLVIGQHCSPGMITETFPVHLSCCVTRPGDLLSDVENSSQTKQ